MVQRAEGEMGRIRELVDQGTLPKSKLEEAQSRLDDARDQLTLTETLYGDVKIQDMTTGQADLMVAAAQSRVDREQKIYSERKQLLETGIIAKSELVQYEDELNSRRRVLELATNRRNLLGELHQMAAAEKAFEADAQTAREERAVMMRFAGNGFFNPAEIRSISEDFRQQFHRELPISAFGQTAVHQALGLDHRNRIDVALNPDSPEGIWLRHLLETRDIPYLAFRSAVPGAATAPHIHIGTGSSRLHLAQR